jgi:hypothetical protein
MRKYISKSILVMITGIILLSGCGASNISNSNSMEPKLSALSDIALSEAEEMPAGSIGEGSVINTPTDNRKIIKTVSMNIESKHFEIDTENLQNLAINNGGYIESSSIENRSSSSSRSFAYYVFKIPTENLDNFLNSTKSDFLVIKNNTNAEDISFNYYDTEARIASLRIQQTRLNELVKAASGLEDIILLNQQLSEVEYQIESLTGSIKRWDNQIEYTAVSIEVRGLHEADVSDTAGFLDKLGNTFYSSLKLMRKLFETTILIIVFLVPYAIIAGVLSFVIYKIIKMNTKKKKEKIQIKKVNDNIDKKDRNIEKDMN